MGWRAWDAYERDAEVRRRALPLRKRYSWRGVLLFALILAIAAFFALANIAQSEQAYETTTIISSFRWFPACRNEYNCGGREVQY